MRAARNCVAGVQGTDAAWLAEGTGVSRCHGSRFDQLRNRPRSQRALAGRTLPRPRMPSISTASVTVAATASTSDQHSDLGRTRYIGDTKTAVHTTKPR